LFTSVLKTTSSLMFHATTAYDVLRLHGVELGLQIVSVSLCLPATGELRQNIDHQTAITWPMFVND